MSNLIHSFSVEEAEKYGVEKAVILYNFRFWLTKNMANDKNNIDGYVWTYNSAAALAKLFPYLNAKKISRLLKDLEVSGALITGNYNQIGYDRTKWYSMPEFSTKAAPIVISHICEMDSPDMSNGFPIIAPPIPDSKPDNKTDIKTKTSAKLKFDDKDLDFVERMYQSLLNQDSRFKKPNLKQWADIIRKMRVIDGRDYDTMAAVWTWARKDPFWYKNILSATKFRHHFQALYLNTFPANNLTPPVVNEEKQRKRAITANVLDINNTDW
tara:strand:+ start:185 stop:991 length:807 start_codon:yes stop_codon:yes gene_type:complete